MAIVILVSKIGVLLVTILEHVLISRYFRSDKTSIFVVCFGVRVHSDFVQKF